MKAAAALLLTTALLDAQLRLSREGTQQKVEIHNVTHHLAGERLVLRKIVDVVQLVGDKGQESKVTVEAFPLASERKGKPLYSITLSGVDATVLDGELLSFERGTEEVEWWSVYRLADGRPLFDTVAMFSWSSGIYTPRYLGLLVPEDGDPLLRDEKLVAVLQYASVDRVPHRVRIACDDMQRARLLRSYWDQTRTRTVQELPRAVEIASAATIPTRLRAPE